MFNVTVIKLRDLIKYISIIIAIVLIIYIISKHYFLDKQNGNAEIEVNNRIGDYINSNILNCINKELPIAQYINSKDSNQNLIDENNEDADKDFTSYFLTSMIEWEFSVANIAKDDKKENTNMANSEVDTKNTNEEAVQTTDEGAKEDSKKNNNSSEINFASTNVKTEVVTENPLADTYTQKYNGVKIKNGTDFELTDNILNPDNLEIDTSNIIIFHTHTCESYTSSEKYSYIATGNFRTTDLNYSVARVGDELTNYLTAYGYNVTHDKTYHDYPAYSGSYNRSLSTVSKLLETNKSDIIIDLHRDAIGSYSTYAPTVKIGDDYCAQIMFVIGTNGGGLNHPNWNSNLKFAVKLQEVANSLYPGLFKPIILRNSRYNQHLGKAACIIEVGATGNTLEQCLNSMKYLSEVMNCALN